MSPASDISAAPREKIAATARGEANKIPVITQAETEATQKKLRGEGVAAEHEAQGFDTMRDMRRPAN